MKNKIYILLTSAFLCGVALSGCAINSMSSEEIQAYIQDQMAVESERLRTESDATIQSTIDGYAQTFLTEEAAKNLMTEEVKKDMLSKVETDLKTEIAGLSTLSDGQKEEVNTLIAQALGNEVTTAEVTVDGEDGDANADGTKTETKDQKKTETTTTTSKDSKTTTTTSETEKTTEKEPENKELTEAQKKEIDKLVTAKMATVVRDAGIVVEDKDTSNTGSVTTEEKTTILNNIQTLFNAHNTLVKDLESMNKKVGENTSRIEILCSQVGSLEKNNNNNNGTVKISSEQIDKLKSDIEKDVILYIIKYFSN